MLYIFLKDISTAGM